MKYVLALLGVSFILNQANAMEMNGKAEKINAAIQSVEDLKGSL